MRLIVEAGPEPLYRGELGKRLCEAVQAAGGWLSMRDLEAFRPEWGTPIARAFHEHEMASVPPPAAGIQVLETLGILEGYDFAALGHNSGDALHLIIEAVKLTMADRIAYQSIPDPPVAGLLSPLKAPMLICAARKPSTVTISRQAMERSATSVIL